MTPFFLYHPKTRPTGRALAKLLRIACGTKVPIGAEKSLIIRWGNIRDGWIGDTAINTQQAVALAGNKFKSLQVLAKAGVPVPTNYRNPIEMDGIQLGRAFRHSRGTDIVIFDDKDTPGGCDYYTEYIEPHKEYRIHVMGGKILFAQKKYFREELFHILCDEFYGNDKTLPEMQKFVEEKDIIRNNEHGWGFHDMNDVNAVPEVVRNASICAVDALGLDFGAVDVISVKNGEKGSLGAFVLEINTAPGLRDRNLIKYAEGLKCLLGK